MHIEFNPITGKLSYGGLEIGEYVYKDGQGRVTLNMTYDCSAENWLMPIVYLNHGLNLIHPEPGESVSVETSADSLAEPISGVRMLTEKTLKGGNYSWRFHKSDVDSWPSALHGHDYENHLTLDALTGDIYDPATRKRLSALKFGALEQIRAGLRSSKDFAPKVAELLDGHKPP
jgi:hypothetical protein